MSIFKKRQKPKSNPSPIEANLYPELDVNTLPDDGIVVELEPTEWMAPVDIVNEIDPNKFRCWMCFKYIDKKDCVHPDRHICADREQCERNLKQKPKVTFE